MTDDMWLLAASIALVASLLELLVYMVLRRRRLKLRRAAKQQRRKLLQENMRGLVVELSETSHESQDWLLRQAFDDTLTEYRGRRA